MSRKIAIKRLTASDLTIFEGIFKSREGGGNQKSINLNADVFINEMYPSLPDAPEAESGRLPVDMYIYGPGLGAELNLQRKIIKHGTYKNWRLDGEFIRDDPARFDVLHPGDYVVIEFIGSIFPMQARLLFAAASVPVDAGLHMAFGTVVPTGPRGMISVSAQQLAGLIRRAAVSAEHPANELILDAALEDAAQGGLVGIQKLLSRRSGHAVSVGEFRRARAQNDRDGEMGEEFVNEYLGAQKDGGHITEFNWESRDNPVSPYDFTTRVPAGRIKLDVKATRGEFERSIHISTGQLIEMVRGPERYDVYRVYAMTEQSATMRMATNVKAVAERILTALAGLPPGVTVDSVSVQPQEFGTWGAPITLSLSPDDE